MGVKKTKESSSLELISFRVAQEILAEIKEYAKEQITEEGIPLSEAQAARKLMMEALKAWRKKRG